MTEDRAVGVAIVVHDLRRLYRKRAGRPSPAIRVALRSLTAVLDELAEGSPTRLYLGFRIGPPEAVSPGSIKATLFHPREKSLELEIGLDSTLPDEEVGPAVGRLAIDGLEFGRRQLLTKKVDFQIDGTVERIERWIGDAEWLVPLETPAEPAGVVHGTAPDGPERWSDPDGAKDRLEIHVRSASPGVSGIRALMTALEDDLDRVLAGHGTLEGNEIGGDEWVVYIDCPDPDIALGKLTTRLRAIEHAGSVSAIVRGRVLSIGRTNEP